MEIMTSPHSVTFAGATTNDEKEFCDSCGRCVTCKGTSIIGASIALWGETAAMEMTAAIETIYPELKDRREFKICYVCWLRGLGVKI